MAEKLILCWSGGKDSALALHEIRRRGRWEAAALLTTFTADYDRVSMHGVRRALVERQAESIGCPLEAVAISKDASEADYESQMRRVLERHKAAGVAAAAFGDVFLADVRKRREDNLAKVQMRAVLPLWGQDTRRLARRFIRLGFQAVTTSVDTDVLDKSFVGRAFDESFLADLPVGADPCGENGEFHSFVFDGPLFARAVAFQTGPAVLRENRFYFLDLLPPPTEAHRLAGSL